MSVIIQGSQLRTVNFGTKVDKAAATVPQNALSALFTVSGGRVVVTGIVGEVTTVIGGTTPSAKLVANPTTGADSDITTATAITGDAVGNLYGVSTVGGALGVLESVAPMPQEPFVLKAGTLDLHVSAADATGAIKWSLFYVPLDDGASVVAA
ncbi:hypothetical protein I5Q34_33290 [Streptomyces sp. AV19]|uniref:hypothetical protein n=1 Tax=Streptomyces sp. AV19 TaxID=2793068 RepID=UPI0018FE43E5|nr:hypothetical protein [Streptomyces sp. AV19]MBH1939079.1 hypothetical protein [Streptomyces sp. AV19]MDG4535321.1 hypothetical protein [Streptomyces sp. AV19]